MVYKSARQEAMPLDIRIRFGRALRRIREEQELPRRKLPNAVGCAGPITAAASSGA
jgi:hypothetical protein